MRSKRNLDAALSGGLSKRPIQKGEDFRLSTISEEVEEAQLEELQRQRADVHEGTSAQEHIGTSALVPVIKRPSRGQRIRSDYLREIKRIAFEEERKDYEVIEEALEEYLRKRGRL